jgi:integrase/recombinase XerD
MQEAGELAVIENEVSGLPALIVPASIEAAGTAARFAWEEFFLGQVRNPHTRTSYMRAVRRFLQWIEQQQIDLPRITPGMVGHYFNELPLSTPSKKVHLAGVRAFFDVLVNRHVIMLNPSSSVRTERYTATEGLTPEITVEQARKLLASIELKSLIDVRDRAIIAVLIYTAARAGAVAKLRLRDFSPEAGQHVLRFAEKNGKARIIPCRHDLQSLIQDYMFVANLDGDNPSLPLFRTVNKQGRFTDRAVSGVDVCRMVKRRLVSAELPVNITAHSFRSCTATDLLLQGVPLEDVQYLLGHSDSRTTKIYDRRRRQVTRHIVERISV